MNSTPTTPARRRNPYMVAVVLGTALSALPATAAPARATTPDTQVVQDISRYCTVCWRNAHLPPDTWGDCTQEVFRRLLQRVDPNAWRTALKGEGDERREFLRAIDAVKKRTQRGCKRSTQLVGVVSDGRDPQAQQRAQDRAAVDQAASQLLSERQQKILQMSFEGWSVHDIATQLALSPERVSDEKYKAVRKLRTHLCPTDQVG
jgi:RNA polymerase sigma factor (sigma-70 family)